MTAVPSTWLDVAIFAVVVLAGALGAMKGLIRGLFSLLSIPASLAVAFRGYRPVGKLVRPFVGDDTVSLVLAFFALMISIVIVMIFIGVSVRALALRLKLGWIDRALGTVLGAAKGVLISGLVLWLALGIVPKTRRLVDRSSWATPSVAVAQHVVRLVGAHLPRFLPDDGPETGPPVEEV